MDGQMRQTQLNNWQIANVTPPANYFHNLAVSDVEDFLPGTRFHRVYPEQHPDQLKASDGIRKVVFCSGKIYYELLEKRQYDGIDDVALVRLEQISPFPFDHVAK